MPSLKINRLLPKHTSIVLLKVEVGIQSQTNVKRKSIFEKLILFAFGHCCDNVFVEIVFEVHLGVFKLHRTLNAQARTLI